MTIARRCPTLVLALGNDLLGDDGVALLAARALQEEFAGHAGQEFAGHIGEEFAGCAGERFGGHAGQESAGRADEKFSGHADFVETGEAGLALLESLEGYARALILDSIATGQHAPGTILELAPTDFQSLPAPSPHYAGLPDVLELGRRLGVAMPGDLRILAMEIAAPKTLGAALTPPVAQALPAFIARARAILKEGP